jgi:DNA polymerase-1
LLTIGHNLKFDMHMSANEGILLGRECEDTQVNAAMLDEYQRSYSLESCAEIAKVTAKKGQGMYEHLAKLFGVPAEREAMGHFWRTSGDDPVAVDYALGDGITTLELREKQQKWIEDDGMGFIHRVESRLIWSIFRAERRGIKVDEGYIEQLIEAVGEEIAEARGKFPDGFNFRSPLDVHRWMEQAGYSDWPKTPGGAPSMNKKYLERHPEGRLINTVRELENLGSKFIFPLKERFVWNGRVHANLHQLKADEYGTVTGRLSCSDPNLQAIPKRNKKLGRRFRTLFVPDEGMEFYEGDYSQCEPRLYAHYSQDANLINGYLSDPPKDVHDVVAMMLEVERDPTAKRMNMGIFTGMQKKTFAAHMEWPLERAAAAHDAWFEAFPGIKGFQDGAKSAFRRRGWVKTILGRIARLDKPGFAYKGASRIIQGGNADILKERWLRCDEYVESEGDQVHFLMNVHDAFQWQAPLGAEGERQSAELVRIAQDVQSPPFNLRVPIPMEVGKGPNWAIATYGPEKVVA